MCGLPGGEFAVLLRGVALAEWSGDALGGVGEARVCGRTFGSFADFSRSGILGAANLERQTWSGIRHPTALCASDAGTRASHTERLIRSVSHGASYTERHTRSGMRHPTALRASDAGPGPERLARSDLGLSPSMATASFLVNSKCYCIRVTLEPSNRTTAISRT